MFSSCVVRRSLWFRIVDVTVLFFSAFFPLSLKDIRFALPPFRAVVLRDFILNSVFSRPRRGFLFAPPPLPHVIDVKSSEPSVQSFPPRAPAAPHLFSLLYFRSRHFFPHSPTCATTSPYRCRTPSFFPRVLTLSPTCDYKIHP